MRRPCNVRARTDSHECNTFAPLHYRSHQRYGVCMNDKDNNKPTDRAAPPGGPKRDAERLAQSQEILDRVERDGAGLFSVFLNNVGARAGTFFAGPADARDDRVEMWARITGRTLGVLALLVLLTNLFTGWFF